MRNSTETNKKKEYRTTGEQQNKRNKGTKRETKTEETTNKITNEKKETRKHMGHKQSRTH